jgi:glycosyltransferase involved in cell wall biosynthesis
MLSLIIPYYNSALYIEDNLRRLLDFLPQHFDSFEIIAVDDGSSDATPERLKNLAADSRVQTVLLPQNVGKGGALKAGVAASRGEYVLFTDADLPYDLSALPRFVEALESGCEVVLGTRRGSEHDASAGTKRTLLSRIFLALANRVLLHPVSDTQCGIKGFSAKAAHQIFGALRTKRFCFDVEAIVIAQKAAYRLCELPVVLVNADSSSVRVGRDGLQMLADLASIYVRHRS